MKTKDELHALKNEVEVLREKLAELNEDEMKLVTGGEMPPPVGDEKYVFIFPRIKEDEEARDAMTHVGRRKI